MKEFDKEIGEHDGGQNNGCEFCRMFDFSAASAKIDLGKYAHIHLAGGSYRYPKDEQFNYCPVCGKSL